MRRGTEWRSSGPGRTKTSEPPERRQDALELPEERYAPAYAETLCES
ncbi:hypothetical protein HCC61_28100 [Streptomyces sp. HNM0575]|nr:hypothetical protein [Streptomyces sp. HNM0575]NLU76439.1 hypothetical protein [Streptomyces sp. HNM0575]